jgi:hypothetical protein
MNQSVIRSRLPWMLLVGSLTVMPAVATASSEISGDYLEARTADVYTGPCFANGEVNLTGREAVMAWRVREGSWRGVDLAGLAVVAVVKAQATLGDPFATPYPARAVVILDENATAEQRTALAHLARARGGELLANVIATHVAKIETSFEAHRGEARLAVPGLLEVRTRPMCQDDHICGNEFVYYPPLSRVSDAVPAYTLANRFEGDEFNSTWSSPLKRSAFVATFSGGSGTEGVD